MAHPSNVPASTAAKRAMLEAYEQGIYYDGVAYLSPEMRRELYENLRLRVTVGRAP